MKRSGSRVRGSKSGVQGVVWTTIVFLTISRPMAQIPQPPAPQLLPKGVEIRIDAEPKKATVGDLIRIDLDITMPKGYGIRFPDLDRQIGDFTILEAFPGPLAPEPAAAPTGPPLKRPSPPRADEPVHHRARIIVALYKPGDYVFPPIALSLRDPSGKETSISSPAVQVQIQSVLTDNDRDLKELKKQAEIPEPVRWLLWCALGCLVLVLAAVAWWLWRRRRRSTLQLAAQPQIDPLQLAESELRDLLGRGLLEKGSVKQFYVLLSDIAKKMIEAGYAVPTKERTTTEIMETLRADHALGVTGDSLESIESLLLECDLVKFAKYIPQRAENDAAVQNVFHILEVCKLRRAAPVFQGAAQTAGAP